MLVFRWPEIYSEKTQLTECHVTPIYSAECGFIKVSTAHCNCRYTEAHNVIVTVGVVCKCLYNILLYGNQVLLLFDCLRV